MSGLLKRIRERLQEQGTRPQVVVCPVCGEIQNRNDFDVIDVECGPCFDRAEEEEQAERERLRPRGSACSSHCGWCGACS